MIELLTRSRHEGPIWRHSPSLREWLVIALVMAALFPVPSLLGLPPVPWIDAIHVVGEFALALATLAVAFGVVEVAYHRWFLRSRAG
ncbi:MAG: hypothetical protein ABIW50_01825 [Candidatus Limnocylindria bacterium]